MAKVKKMALGGEGNPNTPQPKLNKAPVRPPTVYDADRNAFRNPTALDPGPTRPKPPPPSLSLYPDGTFRPGGPKPTPMPPKPMPPMPLKPTYPAPPKPMPPMPMPPMPLKPTYPAPPNRPNLTAMANTLMGLPKAPPVGNPTYPAPPNRPNLTAMANSLPTENPNPPQYFKKGGKVKSSSASNRGDGIAQRGKTKGRFV